MESQHHMKVVAILRSREANQAVSGVMARVGRANVDVRLGDIKEFAPQLVNGHCPDILLADISLDDPADIEALGRFARERAGTTAVIATAAESTLEGVRQLMRHGILDFVPQPIMEHDLIAALDAAVERRLEVPQSPGGAGGRIIAYLKACGGAGSSMIAAQSALIMGEAALRRKTRVALLDFDFQFGNSALYLDIDAKVSIEDVLESPERLDSAFLQGVMGRHKRGVDVLPAATRPVPFEMMTPNLANALLRTAAHEYPFVLVDLPQLRSAWTREVLDVADLIVLVTQLTVPGIRQARLQLEAMHVDGVRAEIALVVNRYQKRWFGDGVRLREAEHALGRGIDYFIANDFRTVSTALNQGVPLGEIKPRNRVERDLRGFVDHMQMRLKQEPRAGIPVLAYR